MNYNKLKSINNLKNKPIFVVIFLIILVFALINSVSAMEDDDIIVSETNLLTGNSVHNIASDTTNDDIQSIIDNANSGDTIQFNDKSYDNISNKNKK